jgi:hypothetical protein
MDLVERVKAIIQTPKTEWLAIESESGEPAYLFRNYVAILAAIPAVCDFVGRSIVGRDLPVVGVHRVGVLAGAAGAIIHYLLTFIVLYVMAMIIDALAPSFSAQKNQPNALKLAVYAMTPAWLAGVFALIPGLHILSVLGLYSLYLFWLGLPVLMKAPADKATLYTVAVVACGFVLSFVVGAVIGVVAYAA